jgi:hypothetical protein
MDTTTYILLGAIVAAVLIFLLRHRSVPAERPLLDTWMAEQTLANPTISLDELLNRYIAKYNVCVRATLDEPAFVTAARTKLQLMETTVFANPEHSPDPQLEAFVAGLHFIVITYDSASPEMREALWKK